MNLYKKLQQIADESLHIMIVPHSGKSVRQLKLKKFILYSFVIFIIALCLTLFFLINYNIRLNQQLHKKTEDFAKLQEINKKQSLEIKSLKNKTYEVSKKLEILNELEIQVRSLMGLKSTKKTSLSKPISRSSSRTIFSVQSMPKSDSHDSIDMELKRLTSEMDHEVKSLNDLMDDVKKRLKFLAAKPTKRPASGKITSKFGYRISPITNRIQFHKGIDIANKEGTNIIAAGTGIVTFSGWNSGYGKTIIISHGYGYRSVYAHNKKNLVNVGQKVQKGDIIAKMGSTGRSTGPHVHFEIHYKGKQIDPLTILNK
ncbi:M23 family metallopeptidase [Crassaminicella thermophila]|uniref:M23 family metallopeptidase n=1 Tax=Crassaminicella thermophila TaxID=2599308 RepID=A0A5C0SCJ8_CRATE|nr:M23 family metallopeptidase [Crassaminicella thermophila]QEK11921.1 M23 family metallopeptidase [Crassaminicella thermophila]